MSRMPVAFIPHGGGPWPFVDLGMDKREVDSLAGYLRGLDAALLGDEKPRALLVVSAHWEEPRPTVMTAAHPPILYDYSGFPPEAYAITWPAPGDPALAAHVVDVLAGAGIEAGTDDARGFDHGTFIPLKLSYPRADVPTVQLSLVQGLDPATHLALGEALAPLRDQGVLIVGSGMSFHNMRAFGDPRARAVSAGFDAWLVDAATAAPRERDARLVDWERAPAARLSHPREEHLLPLMVCAGAAGDDAGRLAWSGSMLGARVSAFHFG